MSRTSVGWGIAAVLAAFVASPAGAQTVNPSTLATGNNPAVQQPTVRPTAPRPTGVPVIEGAQQPAEAPAPKQSPKFRIATVLFEGNKFVTTEELKVVAKPFEHRTVTLADLKQMTIKVRELYQSKGYILARAAIPPQKLRAGGDVRVQISEGQYGEIQVEGNKHYSDRFIKRYFERATHLGIVDQNTLQRSLLILNEFPDLTVRSLFLPGKKQGTSDVLLRAHDRTPVHVGLDYNNYGSPLVGRNRAGLALWLGSVLFEGDEITGRYTEPFPSRSDPLIQASYNVPVGNDGNRMTYSFSQAATRVSGPLAVLDIRGDAEIHALQWTRPMERTLSRSINMNAGFVFKTVENFVLGNTRVSQDNLRLLTFGVDSNIVWGKTRTLGSWLITQGLGDMFNGNLQGDPRSSRVGSGNEFTKFNVELFHVRDMGAKQFLLARFSGQASLDPLTVSEQFALGGPDSVRGYLQSDYLGDNGYTTSVEYRKGFYTSSKGWANLQAAAFFDHGDAMLQLPQVAETSSRSFSGAGVGLRGSFGRTTSLRVDLGHRLTDRNSLGDDDILYAQMVSRF